MDQFNQLKKRWTDLPQPQKIKYLRIVVFACYSLALLFFVIYAFGGTSKRVKSPESVIIFMESAPGSLLALRYLVKRVDISIAMIILTINAWNNNLNAAYDNTVAFITTLQKEGLLKYDIPVYYGNSMAQVNSKFFDQIDFTQLYSVNELVNITSCTYRRVLTPELIIKADRLFGASELLDMINISPSHSNSNSKSKIKQPEYYMTPLSQYLSTHSSVFLILGPATDAAAFLQEQNNNNNNKIYNQIHRIIISGGTLSVDGNTRFIFPPNRRSEEHLFFDPHAANYILTRKHGRPVELIPLDAAPKWSLSLYESFITSQLTSSSIISSSSIVAHAVSGYNNYFSFINNINEISIPIELVAAAYFADIQTRVGATVTEMFILVANGVAMSTDGMLGTAQEQEKEKSLKVKIILKLQEGTFWKRFEGVDRLNI